MINECLEKKISFLSSKKIVWWTWCSHSSVSTRNMSIKLRKLCIRWKEEITRVQSDVNRTYVLRTTMIIDIHLSLIFINLSSSHGVRPFLFSLDRIFKSSMRKKRFSQVFFYSSKKYRKRIPLEKWSLLYSLFGSYSMTYEKKKENWAHSISIQIIEFNIVSHLV